jgi:hypothetical protein
MSFQLLVLPIMALLLGAVAVGSSVLEARAFDRRWPHGKHRPE